MSDKTLLKIEVSIVDKGDSIDTVSKIYGRVPNQAKALKVISGFAGQLAELFGASAEPESWSIHDLDTGLSASTETLPRDTGKVN